jgi:hypothetical protein
MISLPDQTTLIRHVCDSLNEVASTFAASPEPPGDWTNAIGKVLSDRLDNEESGIECAYGGGNPNGSANGFLTSPPSL